MDFIAQSDVRKKTIKLSSSGLWPEDEECMHLRNIGILP
jgi:hypothetical protein